MVLAALVNIEVFIFDMEDVPIGKPPTDLPDYIRTSRSINALTHSNHQKPYTDQKCLFRCLALHEGVNIRGLEKATQRIKASFETHTGKSFDNGVNISHLPAIEVYFNVSINVYSQMEELI